MTTIEVITAYGPAGALGSDSIPVIRLSDFLDWSNKREADIRELNDRLIERQESFQAQLIRIEDTWREKLSASQEAERISLEAAHQWMLKYQRELELNP
jgi:pantothenate kinase